MNIKVLVDFNIIKIIKDNEEQFNENVDMLKKLVKYTILVYSFYVKI